MFQIEHLTGVIRLSARDDRPAPARRALRARPKRSTGDSRMSMPAVSPATAPTDAPVVYEPYAAADGIEVIPAYLPIPGMGVLPANSYLVHGDEPLLVDCGPGGTADAFRSALERVVDPSTLRWLWLTHTDPDHTGALTWLLEAAPNMMVITTFLAAGKLGMHMPIPMDRMRWCNPGEAVRVGDRTLHAIRPPAYDAPETVAAYDAHAGVLFSADAFGVLLQEPVADAADISPVDRRDGMALWSSIDAPWILDADRHRFDLAVRGVETLAVETVLSSHLPPATGMTSALLDDLRRVPDASPWQAPDQAALDALLAQIGSR